MARRIPQTRQRNVGGQVITNQVEGQQQEFVDDEPVVNIDDIRSNAQDFWTKNSKLITYVGGGLLAAVLLWAAYKYLYSQPRATESARQIMQAQYQFERDSFQLALENPGGGNPGFLAIINDYSGTPSANIAKYNAGVCYLNLGQYDNAIKYLKDYSAKDDLTSITKYGALGDAYSELKQDKEAMSAYESAVSAGDNEALTPFYMKRLALFNEKMGDKAAAKKLYDKIKEKYPKSQEATDIERYIIRAGK
jgi:tetratricopeptide (TPR) repeat protein